MATPLADLIDLSHALAMPEADMCILAEGNVSATAEDDTFWIKGSGQSMNGILAEGFSLVRLGEVQRAVDQEFGSDEDIRAALNAACIEGPPPSTEAFMHASLLGLPGVRYVAHTHPTPLLSILCLAQAKDFAHRRLFPDEIVCCGPAACFVEYVAPGLELARSIQKATAAFLERNQLYPKTYWLQNHGLIAVGKTAKEVESACMMSLKAARVLLGSLQTRPAGELSDPIRWLKNEEVAHIYHWTDEHARQQALWGQPEP